MERGMIRHLRRDYAGSTMDWLNAVRIETQLETHSLSKAGASMVVNDTTLAFRGYPYEHTYLHVFLARNFLARGMWDDAAVEARQIIRRLERREGFPDDAYSRYLAGLCLELTDDSDGAEVQYRIASSLAPACRVDERTGQFLPAATNGAPPAARVSGSELVCLVDLDSGFDSAPDGAGIYINGTRLGIAHTLADTTQMEWEHRQLTEARRVTKAVARIALKETLSSAVEHENKDLGRLLRLLLYSMEVPDERRWTTLPRRLAVARVPCPPDLKSFDVVFRGPAGAIVQRLTVTAPITRRNRVFFALCRNHPLPED
jgi:hypothetical protein